jgi:hypothetical protein
MIISRGISHLIYLIVKILYRLKGATAQISEKFLENPSIATP